ncbi:MAG: ImmA/IrrE family metallo-endopeptidase [Erysipelotrichaceae bacterium]|nr:ImmA/IrrE family metallo-endopeptidase [Erysipelotrichaceae bacterium]
MIDYTDLMSKAEILRNEFGEDNRSPVDIFAIAQNIKNLSLVFYPFNNNISGMCIKRKNGNNLIAVNSTMTLGRQRFTLAHEFYHLYFENNELSLCSKTIGNGNENERKADSFALYFLMPRTAFVQKVEKYIKDNNRKLSIEDIVRLEQYFGISHQAMVYQLVDCHFIDKKEVDKLLNKGVKNIASSIGFDTKLYEKLPVDKQYATYGYYIDLTNKIYKNNLISDGKYEELLLEGFRDDLVYGTTESGEIID